MYELSSFIFDVLLNVNMRIICDILDGALTISEVIDIHWIKLPFVNPIALRKEFWPFWMQ